MFVHPLTTVFFCPATYGLWRPWHQPRHSCCKIYLFIASRNIFTSLFLSSVLSRSDFERGFHMFSGLMDNHKEPQLKKRKNVEEKDHVRAKISCKHLYLKEISEISSTWPHNATALPPHSRKVPSNTEKTGTRTELRRQWEDLTDRSSCGPQAYKRIVVQPFEFSVMSYNVLSQDLLLSNPYLYKNCNPRILDWHYRLSNILKEVEEHSADIMCLQEVQEDHYEKQIKHSLEYLGYHCEFKRRTGHKLDGCVVAFKHSSFILLSAHPVEFYRRGIPLLDRDNVGLIVMLQPVEELGKLHNICVATTHLLYNPRRGDIKLAQLALLLAEINRVAQLDDGTTCPVVLCGDFNSVPASPLYTFIKENKLEYAGMPIGKVSGQEKSPQGQRFLTVPIWPSCLGVSQLCQFESQSNEPHEKQTNLQPGVSSNGLSKPTIEHKLKLASVYSHYLKENGHPEITTCHSRTAMTVDYIFYSPAKMEKSDCLLESCVGQWRGLQLLARLALVSEAELRKVKGLPNKHHSSDHLPLIARFRLPS